MQIPHTAWISVLAFAPLMLNGQTNQTPAPQSSPPPSVSGAPSSLLQPALTAVESALTSLTLDKWKKGSVREEASGNVNAILRDLKDNVPPMMADADAAPDSLSKSIPLMKHLDAVYDVFLRVEEGARVSAPGDQVDKLIDALKKFGAARIDFYDSMQQRAVGQEKQLADMRTQLKEQQATIEQASKPAPAPAPVPCTPPKPAVKKKRATPKSTTPAPNNQNAPANTTQQPPAQHNPQ